MKPKEAVEEARAGRAKPCLLVQHGRLFGAGGFAASGAAQPLPFIGGPLQKPVVEESFLKQNMLLALGSSLARSPAAATLRSTLAEAMVRSAGRLAAIKDFSVLSLEGAGPTEADWAQQLAGLDTRQGVMVFEKALGPKERVDLAVLQDWLLNDFGSGLSTLAISRVLSSPKPSMYVRAGMRGVGVRLRSWAGHRSIRQRVDPYIHSSLSSCPTHTQRGEHGGGERHRVAVHRQGPHGDLLRPLVHPARQQGRHAQVRTRSCLLAIIESRLA